MFRGNSIKTKHIAGVDEVGRIASNVANRESMSILWLPGGGRTTFGIDMQNTNVLKNIASFFTRPQIAKTRFIYVDLSIDILQLEKYLEETLSNFSTAPTLRGKIVDIIGKKYLYFILDNISLRSLPSLNYVLSFRSSSSSRIKFICQFLERDFLAFLDDSNGNDIPNSLFHNVVRIPYFTKSETIEWLRYKAKGLKVKITRSQAERMYDFCGGVPVLLSASLRNLRNYKNVNDVFSSFEMKNIIKSYWMKFSDTEKRIIGCAAYRQPMPNNPRVIDYLRLHKLLNHDNSFDKLWIRSV